MVAVCLVLAVGRFEPREKNSKTATCHSDSSGPSTHLADRVDFICSVFLLHSLLLLFLL